MTYLHATKTLSHVVTEKFLDAYCKFSGVLLVPNPTSSRASTITPMPLMMNLISVPVKSRNRTSGAAWNFHLGAMAQALYRVRKSPSGVQGRSSGRESGGFAVQKLKQFCGHCLQNLTAEKRSEIENFAQ